MKCKKDELGLPPITQTGANKLGFLLNGQPWTPKGHVGMSANLSLDIDFGYKNGIFGINAYKYVSATEKDVFIIGVTDSLNFLQVPIQLSLNNTSLYGISFTNNQCDYFNQISDVQSSGILIITKLDKINRIIAGTFNAKLYEPGCDTIKITDGRFDMKF